MASVEHSRTGNRIPYNLLHLVDVFKSWSVCFHIGLKPSSANRLLLLLSFWKRLTTSLKPHNDGGIHFPGQLLWLVLHFHCICWHLLFILGFPGSYTGEESICNAGDPDSLDSCIQMIPGRRYSLPSAVFLGFPGGSDSKESACNVGDLGLIPGLGRSPGGGHGNHSSMLAWRIRMDRGAQ